MPELEIGDTVKVSVKSKRTPVKEYRCLKVRDSDEARRNREDFTVTYFLRVGVERTWADQLTQYSRKSKW
jgi:hypothetical protein